MLKTAHLLTQQRHRQGPLIQAHIPHLNICKDTGEESSSLCNIKHSKHTHATRVQNTTLYSDGTTDSKQHRSKGVQPNGPPCANNHCSTRYEQSFRHTTSRDAKPTQHIEITHPHHVNSKLTFHNTIQHLDCRHTTT